MKLKIIFLFLFIGLSFNNFAQIKAVTENGEEVLLYKNKTWSYVNGKTNDIAVSDIKTNPIRFKKKVSASFLLKSQKTNVGFWLNPKKWAFQKAKAGAAQSTLLHIKKAIYMEWL